MYSRITNIYYVKTVGHEETTQKFFFPSKLLFIVVHISATRRCECSEKMAALGEKSFCVLEYHASKSVVTVQRAFRAKYAKDQPTDKTIHLLKLGVCASRKHPCWCVCGKNLSIVWMCATSPMMHTSNISLYIRGVS